MSVLYILGAGTPTPTPERFGTSYVLKAADELMMFDCGPATTYKLVKVGLFPTRIDWLFFTHHHSDHITGYPSFFLCRFDQCIGREEPLRVFGPPPTSRITDQLFGADGAFSLDWKARINNPTSQSVHHNRGGSLPRPGPKYEVSDATPGEVVSGPKWRVTAEGTYHQQPWLESLAYRVDCDEISVVFAGDSGLSDSVVRLATGADVLVANCWDRQDRMDANGEADGQTGTRDAATMACRSGAGKLICTHMGSALASPGSREKGMAEMADIYDGEIVMADELMVLEL